MWFIPTGFDKPIQRFPWATYLLILVVLGVNLSNLAGMTSVAQFGTKAPWRVRGDEWNWEVILRSTLTPEFSIIVAVGVILALFWIGRSLEGTAGPIRFVVTLVGATLFGTCVQMWATERQPNAPYESTGVGLLTALIGMSLWMAPHFRLSFKSRDFGDFTMKMWHIGILTLVACLLISFPPGSQYSGRYYLIPAMAMGFMLPIVLGVPATGKADSARMKQVAQTGTRLSLPLNELKANYESDRNNIDALFYYVCKCGSEGFQADKHAQVQFWKHFDHYLKHKKFEELAAGVAGIYRGKSERPVHQMVKFADQVEEADLHQLSARIYENALNDHRMKDQDREYTLFRLADITFVWLENPEKARAYYQQILDRYPFSHKVGRVRDAMASLPSPATAVSEPPKMTASSPQPSTIPPPLPDGQGTIPANLDS
jgi:hypothetical protein